MPLRMCMVCRNMKEKESLIRVVRVKGESPKVDLTGKAQGRGAYVCREKGCLTQAVKRRVLERAFSCKTDPEVYESLISEGVDGEQ